MFMLRNKWLPLMLLLFVFYGCAGKWRDLYEKEVIAHGNTQRQLEAEETAHGNTQRQLEAEETAHGNTQRQLRAEKTAHDGTQRQLEAEETAHGNTQRQLEAEETAHGNTQRQLNNSLQAVRNTLNQTRTEYSNLAEKYEKLRKIREPSIRDYFELGRVSFEFGVLKEDAEKNTKEALSLYHQGKKALQTVIDANESSDAHYYLARSYYRLARHSMANFEDACAHAKKAINLAPGRKHARAEVLKKEIANCK